MGTRPGERGGESASAKKRTLDGRRDTGHWQSPRGVPDPQERSSWEASPLAT